MDGKMFTNSKLRLHAISRTPNVLIIQYLPIIGNEQLFIYLPN